MKATSVGILAAVFAALLPFITSSTLFYGPINAKFFYVTGFALILALIAGYRLYRGSTVLSIQGRWMLGALGLVLITQYLAAFFGVYPERSLWSDLFWSSGVLFLTHAAAIALLLGELLSQKDWSYIRRAIAFSGGVFGLFLMLGVQGLGFEGKFLWLNLGGVGISLGNETYAGVYLLLAFILTLLELSRFKTWTKLRIWLAVSAVFIALSPILFNFGLLIGKTSFASIFQSPAELLGSARASSATLFILGAFLIIQSLIKRLLEGRTYTILVSTTATLFIVGLSAITALLFTPGSFIQEAYIDQSTAARIIVWEAGMKAIQERPLIGWGPENFNIALERHFDTRLFLQENLAEIWFDKAHNVWIDTLVGSGIIGFAAFAILIAAYYITIYRAREKQLIEESETLLFYALVPAHLLQLQTGFDTVATYTLLAIIGGYVLWLERQLYAEKRGGERMLQKAGAMALVGLALASLTVIVIPEYARQRALVRTFSINEINRHFDDLEKALERDSSFESLRLSSASFLKGSFEVLASNPTREQTKTILELSRLYAERYKAYVADHPDHYRARMNYAYLLLVMMTLGEDRIAEAKEVIGGSYALSPQNPITYILDALAELYSGNLEASDQRMQEALALNPDVEFTQAAAAYFERQKTLFPNLTVLKLTNL